MLQSRWLQLKPYRRPPAYCALLYPMNYQDQLQLEINEIWQALNRAGWDSAATSVEALAADAGNCLVKLMAAHDHACWHMQQLESAGLAAINQYDRDCY